MTDDNDSTGALLVPDSIEIATAIGERTLASIELDLRELDPHCSVEEIVRALDRTYVLIERVRRLRGYIYDLAMAWVDCNGPIKIGTVIIRVGDQKVVSCIDSSRTLDALLMRCGGEIQAVAGYLQKNAFKYGSCRSLLAGPDFDAHFKTEVRRHLETGKPVRRILRYDTRFARDAAED